MIQSFNEKLTTIGYSMGFRCGGTALSAQFLSNSSEYLVKVNTCVSGYGGVLAYAGIGNGGGRLIIMCYITTTDW